MNRTAVEQDRLHLFEGVGIEIEYMIVDSETLDVRPVADEILRSAGGGFDVDVQIGPLAWSNELALHVIELKTAGPATTLRGLAATFQDQVAQVLELAEPLGARLLPTGMHPWMDPETDLRLWPHENNLIYRTFDRIFDCRGHGWANLQSTHINLPFADDGEFARLHAAIRLVLPLLPALAASSPVVDGHQSGRLDSRMEFYRTNAHRVPSVMGHLIPESVFSRREYEEGLLGAIYRNLAPLDPDGVLRHEWVNARGCIARFDRMALEIRVLDVQECPAADLAVAGATIAIVRALVDEAWASERMQRSWNEVRLQDVLVGAIQDGDGAVVTDRDFLEAFGYPERGRARLRDVWQHLIETVVVLDPGWSEWEPALNLYLREGCLARRIVASIEGRKSEADMDTALFGTYARLADALEQGVLFSAVG